MMKEILFQTRCRSGSIQSSVPPIIAAAYLYAINVVQALIAEPTVDVSARGEFGELFLWHICDAITDVPLADLLQRVDIDAQDVHGNTLLMHCIQTRNMKLIPLIVKRGARLDPRNNAGKTAWEIAHDVAYVAIQPEPADREEFINRVAELDSCQKCHRRPFDLQ
jgi:ankyrin repeat protein